MESRAEQGLVGLADPDTEPETVYDEDEAVDHEAPPLVNQGPQLEALQAGPL